MRQDDNYYENHDRHPEGLVELLEESQPQGADWGLVAGIAICLTFGGVSLALLWQGLNALI